MKPVSSREIAALLPVLRAARGLTQAALARASGVPARSISQYERGKEAPSLSNWKRLMAALEITPKGVAQTARFLNSICGSNRLEAAKTQLSSADLDEGEPALASATETRERAATFLAHVLSCPKDTQRFFLLERHPLPIWALAERLAKESSRVLTRDSSLATSLAEWSVALAKTIPQEAPWRTRVLAYAYAHLANVRRVRGNSQEASKAADRALFHLQRAPQSPPMLDEEGRIPSLVASVRFDERRFEEARELLEQAIAKDEGAILSRHHMSLARIAEELGDLRRAQEHLEAAAEILAVNGDDERLHLCALHNHLSVLVSAGDYSAAKERLPVVKALSLRVGTDEDRLRLKWLEGRVERDTGRPEQALSILTAVRGGFAAQNQPFDLALVTLDLAELHLAAGRTAQVKDLARHLAPIFRSQGIHREALAALLLFRQAAEKETMTLDFLRRLSGYLEASRTNAAIRFDGVEPL